MAALAASLDKSRASQRTEDRALIEDTQARLMG